MKMASRLTFMVLSLFVAGISGCKTGDASSDLAGSRGASGNGVSSSSGVVYWACSDLERQAGPHMIDFRTENQANKQQVSAGYLIPLNAQTATNKWLPLTNCNIDKVDSQFSMSCQISGASGTLSIVKIKDEGVAAPDDDYPGRDYPRGKVLASFSARATIPSMAQFTNKTTFSKLYCSAMQ